MWLSMIAINSRKERREMGRNVTRAKEMMVISFGRESLLVVNYIQIQSQTCHKTIIYLIKSLVSGNVQ